MQLNPPSEHQLLVFWVGLLIILVAARGLGALMRRIGQPAVVGELLAGLVLGPSVLGKIAPDVTDWLFPADDAQTAMLFTVGWLGVLLLLVATGFETDLGLIRRLGRAATTVSAGSLLVPMAAGLLVGWYIPSSFVGSETERYIFALFIAAALSISSLPVIAKILSEMGLMRRNFGQLTLAAGMANDVIGWIALGFIAGLAQAGGVKLDKLAFTVVGVAIFFGLAFTVGQRAVDRALRNVRSKGDDPLAGLTVVLITALTFGVITQWLHVEAVLGAFVAGVILARSRFADHELIKPLETMTAAIFAPVFFATAGLRVDLGLLADLETLWWALIVLAAASASKFFGSIIGAQVSKLPIREGAALGIGLNARGALEIVIATVGLSLGVLNDRSYTVIVLMAMATSMLAPPMLRRVLANWEGNPEERRRLDQESQLQNNRIVTGGRILLPTRGGQSSLLAAQVIDLAWPKETEITLLTIGNHPDIDLAVFHSVLHGRSVDHEIVGVDSDPTVDEIADAIGAEARLGYDTIVMGTPANLVSDHLFSTLIDTVWATSPVPTVVVRQPRGLDGRLPWAFSRAVVPVSGAASSRGGQEIAVYLSSQIGTQLHQLHVLTNPASRLEAVLGASTPALETARHILDEAAMFADTIGANHISHIEHAQHPGDAIVDAVVELGADLVVLSGTTRTTGDAPFLGHTLQHVLDRSDATIIVASTPDTSSAAGTPGQPAQDATAH
jgi:Kef-type K+ transport system membrane component KefB/nucleotide-binding universal stress UspA family protein